MSPLPPEILEQIGSHLNNQSRLSSLQVNRLWNEVFTASLWHTISSDDTNPWRRIFKPANYQGFHTCNYSSSHDNKDKDKGDDGEPEEEREFRIRQLQKHGHLIRHITLYDSWSVGLLLQARVVTQLKSLVIFGYLHSAHSGLSADVLTELAKDVPVHLFKRMWHDSGSSSVALARACWQLIVNNHGLTSVKFMSSTMQSMAVFDAPHSENTNSGEDDTTASDDDDNLLLTPTHYLTNVVSKIHRLSHLRLTPSPAEWLLPALANSLLPTIRSYVYSNGDMTTLDNFTSPSPSAPCTTLESLQILPQIHIRHLRSIASAFPGLKKLEMRNCHADSKDAHLLPYNPSTPPPNSTKGSNNGSSSMEVIVHTGMEHIATSEIYDLLRAQVHFPNLKTFGPIGEIVDLRQFLLILRSFPALECLYAFYLKGQDSDRDSRLPIEKEPDWKLKTLILRANQFRPRTMTRILAKMPFLVRLELRSLTPDTLALLATPGRLRFLEHVRFNLRQPCYEETNRLFVVCPNLRSIQGLGIAILAEDMIAEPRWTCLRLQKFHCEIHGIPRLDPGQEAQLYNDDQRQLLELHRQSLSVQRQVYQQLARFTDLRYLDAGFSPRRYQQYSPTSIIARIAGTGDSFRARSYNTPIHDSLSFSLASGLDELATLHRLETFGFKAVNHQIGEEELQWMSRHWRGLKTVYGLDAYVDGFLCDEKADKLGRRLNQLVPGCKLEVFQYSDSFED
ncbi:hypothetical protein BGZ91_009425 [Linnemannia elongata]|nr:hypothetical protein BGZ91_009425 [Linnemannia elongata]